MSAKTLSRRSFLRSAGAASAAAALAPVAGSLSAAAPQQAEVTMSLWGFAPNRIHWFENVVEEIWGPANPNITLNIEETPYTDLWPKLQAAFAADAGVPDIVDVEISAMGQFVQIDGNEPFVELDGLLGDERDNLTLPSATKPWSVRGRTYGIGNEVNPVLLYYRHDFFDELGLDPEAANTWQEFVDLYGAAVVESGRALFPLATQSWADFYIQYHQAGGQFFDEDGNPSIINDLAAEVLAWQKARLDSGVYIEQGLGDVRYAMLQAGDYVTIWGAPWFQGFFKQNAPDAAGQWKMRFLPRWSEGGLLTVPRGGTGMSITKASQHPDEAWEFIRVGNLTVEGSLLAFREMNLFPSYIPAWEAEELYRTDDYFSGQKPAEYIAEAAAGMAEVNVSPNWTLLIDSINRLAVQPVMLEGADPATALADAVDDFEFSL